MESMTLRTGIQMKKKGPSLTFLRKLRMKLMLSDYVKVQDRVMFLLERYPEVRDSDKLLWLAYNCHFNNLKEVSLTGKYENFKAWLLREEVPVFESLSRARRKIQEEKPELAGEKQKRLQESKKVRVYTALEKQNDGTL